MATKFILKYKTIQQKQQSDPGTGSQQYIHLHSIYSTFGNIDMLEVWYSCFSFLRETKKKRKHLHGDILTYMHISIFPIIEHIWCIIVGYADDIGIAVVAIAVGEIDKKAIEWKRGWIQLNCHLPHIRWKQSSKSRKIGEKMITTVRYSTIEGH